MPDHFAHLKKPTPPKKDHFAHLSPYKGGYQSFGSSQYLKDFTTESDPNLVKARNQGFWDSIGNAAVQTIGGVGLEVAEGTGYLIEGVGNVVAEMTGAETDFGNAFSNQMRDWNKDLKENGMPVYTSAENEGFRPWDYKWLATNLPSIASAVSLAIPGYGAIKGIGALGKLMGGRRALKMFSRGRDILEGASAITMAGMSRHMEGMMEGMEVFETLKQEALYAGKTEEEAIVIASKGAASTYNKNLPLIMGDILQFGMAFKSFKALSRAASATKATKMGFAQIAGEVGLQMGTEAGEEAIQYVAGEESKRTARIEGGLEKDDYSVYSDRILNYATRGDFWTSAFMGALGGGVFAGFGALAKNKELAKQQAVEEIQTRAIEQTTAVLKNDPLKFAKSTHQDINMMSISGIEMRRAKEIEDMYKTMLESKPPEGQEETVPGEYEELREKAKIALEDLHYLEGIYNDIHNDVSKDSTPELVRFELINRSEARINTRLLKVASERQEAALAVIATERGFDSAHASLLKAQTELSALNAIAESSTASDDTIQTKRKALEEDIIRQRDTIKTTEGISDEQLDTRFEISIASLAKPSLDKALYDLNLLQNGKDYYKLQTEEGRREIQEAANKHKVAQQDRELNNLLNQITPQISGKDFEELQAAARQLGKSKEFAEANTQILNDIKAGAPKFNPQFPGQSLSARFTAAPLLGDFELAELHKYVPRREGIPPDQFTPQVLDDLYKRDKTFAEKVDKYYARLESKVSIPKKGDIKKQATAENPEGGSTDSGGSIPKPEVPKARNRHAWNLQSIQFELQTTFEDEAGLEYTQKGPSEFYVSKTPNLTDDEKTDLGNYDRIDDTEFKNAQREYAIPDVNKPSTYNLAKKMKNSWTWINQGGLPKDATLHFEYDFEDEYNVGLSEKVLLVGDTYKLVTKDGDVLVQSKSRAEVDAFLAERRYGTSTFEAAYYVDGNTNNKQSSNRKLIGFLTAYVEKDIYESPEAKQGLKNFRKSLYAAMQASGFSTGVITLPFTTGIQEMYKGHFWKSSPVEYSNPFDVLRGDQTLTLAVAVTHTQGTEQSVVLETNGSPLQNKIKYENVTRGGTYMIIEAPNHEYVPVKLYTKKVGEVEGLLPDVVAEIQKIKTAKTSQAIEAVINELSDTIYLSEDGLSYANGVYTFKTGDWVAQETHFVKEEELEKFVAEKLMVQIDKNLINQGDYNEIVTTREFITTDLNSHTHFHSPTVIIVPVLGHDVKTNVAITGNVVEPKAADIVINQAIKPERITGAGSIDITLDESKPSQGKPSLVKYDASIKNKILNALGTKTPIKLEVSFLKELTEFDRDTDEKARGKINDLKKSIKEKGLEFPLEIIVNSKGNVLLAEGNHRLIALEELGYKEVPVIVRERGQVQKDILKDKAEQDYYYRDGKKLGLNLNIDFGGGSQLTAEQESYTPLNPKEAAAWLAKRIPQFDVTFTDNLIEMYKKGGPKAWGVFYENAIKLYKGAPKGTEHHEAFHAVFNMLLNKEQKEQILNEAAILYNIPRSFDEETSSPRLRAVEYQLAAIEKLQSPKAEEIFKKGEKNKWTLDKILQELQVPKDQQELIKSFDTIKREDIITSLLASHTYTIEVNTALTDNKSDLTAAEVGNYWYYYTSKYDEGVHKGRPVGYSKRNKTTHEYSVITEQEYNDAKTAKVPSQYYSDLTVQGGTNYTENEIATPDITPAIQGHAQFATEKGIGWFRSDDQRSDTGTGKMVPDGAGGLVQEGQVGSKTRRILEVQSDLFQKGRDRENLVQSERVGDYRYITAESNEEYYQLEGEGWERDGTSEEGFPIFRKANQKIDTTEKAKQVKHQNKFVQLLNKENNWVTFFIKSIVQDSAKDGYGKVLFPAGDTASKVEGHQTLEDYLVDYKGQLVGVNRKLVELEEANVPESTQYFAVPDAQFEVGFIKVGDLWYREFGREIELGKGNTLEEIGEEYSVEDIDILTINPYDDLRKDKKHLEKTIIDIEKEGFSKLKPIHAFYEQTVGNILKKIYGNNVNRITDEHGNQWFELTITEKHQEAIRLSTAETEYYNKQTNDVRLEEALADDFMRFIQQDQANEGTLGYNIKNFFKKLWEFMKSIFTNDVDIESLFTRINVGLYKNAKPGKSTAKRFKPQADPYRVGRNVRMINHWFFTALDAYKKRDKLEDLTDADAIKTIHPDANKAIMEMYINVYEGLIDKYYEADGKGDAKQAKELLDIVNNLFLVKDGKIVAKGDYYVLALRDLSKFGVRPKTTGVLSTSSHDSQTMEQQAEISEEEDALEGWQIKAIEQNGKDSLSFRVRKMLRRTVEHELKGTGKWGPTSDEYGFPKFVQFDELYNYIERNIAGHYNVHDMMTRIEELIGHRPELYAIHKTLKEDPILQSQFFSNFAKAYTPYSQVRQMIRNTYEFGMETTTIEYRVYNANRKNLTQILIDDWNLNLITPSRNGVTNKDGSIDKEAAKKLYDEYIAVLKEVQAAGVPNMRHNEKLSKILLRFGIDIAADVLQKEYQQPAITKTQRDKAYDAYMNFMANEKASIKKILRSIAGGVNPYTGTHAETSSAVYVAKTVERNIPNLHQDTFFNVEGKQVYSYLLPTFINKKIQELKDPNGRDQYMQNWWFKSNKWLQDLNSPNNADILAQFDLTLLDGLLMQNRKGKKYFEMTPQELDITDINMFDNQQARAYGYYRLPILADSPQAPYLKFKKYSEQEIIDGFYQLALAERDRIEKARGTNIKIKNWNTVNEKGIGNNGLKYNFVEIFNNPDIDIANAEAAKAEIKKWLDNEGKIEQQRLIKNGVMNSKGFLYKNVSDTTNNNRDFFRNYFYNKTFANAMMTQLLSVDLAFYENHDDFLKRNAQVYRFTKMIDIDADYNGESPGTSYNTIYINDIKIKSELKKVVYEDLIEKGYPKEYATRVSEAYDDVNQTDAQTYITPKRRRKIAIGLGEWDKNKEAVYKKYVAGKAKDNELNEIFSTLKPFYFGHEPIHNTDLIVPVQHKNSEVTLFRNLANRSPILKELLAYMEKNDIDSVLFTSAVKVGQYGVVDYTNLKDAVVHTMDNKYFGIAQENPEHHLDAENLYGSQVKKLGISDIPPKTIIKGPFGEYSKEELTSIYQKLLTDNMRESYAKLLKELGTIQNVQALLLEQVVERNLGEYYEKALEIVPDQEGNEVFNLPLFLPSHAKIFESLLNSAVRNRVIKQKINGGSFALMSNFGFTKKLRVVRKPDGGIDYMEVMLPPWMKEYFPRNANGEVDIDAIEKFDPSILDMFGYRIPTEHKYSMKKLKVVGFTPDIMGGIAMLPAEITTIAGEDFDIDKMYVMIPNTYKVYNWKDLFHDFNLGHDFLNWRKANDYPDQTLKDIIDTIEMKIELEVVSGSEQTFYNNFQEFLKRSKDKYVIGLKKVEYGLANVFAGDDLAELSESKPLNKKQRDNALMDILGAIWSSPEVSDQILIPGGFPTLSALAEASPLKAAQRAENHNPILPRSQIIYFQQYTVGNQLIGIAANHNVSHAILQFSNIALARSVMFNGKSETKLNKLKAFDGKLISRNIAEYVAAFVDNVKKPISHFLNLNTFTFDTVAMIVRLGYDLKTANDFITQPVIRAITDEYFRLGASRSAENNAFNAIIEKLNGKKRVEVQNVIHALNLDNLETSTETDMSKWTDTMREEQMKVLYTFKRYKNLAESLAKLVRATRTDTLGTRKSMAGNSKAIKDVHKALEDHNLEGVADLILGDQYPLVRDSIQLGLIKPQNDILATHFPYAAPAYQTMYDRLEAIKGSEITENELNYVNNLSLIYHTMGFGMYDMEDRGYWINEYPTVFLKEAMENEKVMSFEVMKYLKFVPKSRKEGQVIDKIEFTSGATISNEQRVTLQRSFDATLNSDDATVMKVAHDLAEYSFFTTGLSFSYGGFSHLIPTNYLDKLTDENGNFRDYMYKLQGLAKNPRFFEQFLDQLYRHELGKGAYGLLKKLDPKKDLIHRKIKGFHLTSFIARPESIDLDANKEPLNTFVKLQNNDYTYKFAGTTPTGDIVYNIVEQLGEGNNIFEFDPHSYSNTVVAANKLPNFGDDAYYTTTDTNSQEPGEEMYQIDSARELEIKFGIVDAYGIYKSYGEDGKGQSSTNAYTKALNVARDINKQIRDLGYKASPNKQTNPKGGVNWIVQIADENYQFPDEDSSTPDQQLNDVLVRVMHEAGIKVEYVEDLQTRTGLSVSGLADLTNKIIKVSKKLEKKDTLPEEVGHMAEGYNRGSEAHNRLMSIIEHTPEYAAVVEKYGEAYEGDVIKLKRETIGQLIGSAIIKENKGHNNFVVTFLQKLWNDFISLFVNVDEAALRAEIEEITGQIAHDVLSGGLSRKAQSITVNGVFLQLNTKKEDKAKKLLRDGADSIFKKIKLYEKRDPGDYTENEKEVLAKLKKSYDENRYKEGLLDYVTNAKKELEAVSERFESIDQDPQTPEDRRETLKTLRVMKNFVDGFRATINGIVGEGIFTGPEATEVATVAALANEIERRYYNVGKPILAELLEEFSTNPKANLSGALDVLEKDISWFQRMLDQLAECSDAILNVLDVLVKDAKHRARLLTLDLTKQLLQAQKDLEAAGIPSTHFMFERDFEGNLTGNIISEYNDGEFHKQMTAFFKSIPEPTKEQYPDPKELQAALKLRGQKIGKWFSENTEEHPSREKIVADKKEEFKKKHPDPKIAQKKYDEWYAKNARETTYYDYQAGELITNIRYRKELAIPIAKYKSQVYKELYPGSGGTLTPQQKAMRKYYELTTKMLKDADNKLPEVYKLDGMSPQVRKDFFERATFTDQNGNRSLKSLKQIGGDIKTTIGEQFVRHENDLEYGLTDENGRPVNFLPVHFTRRLKNRGDMSLDMTSNMIAFLYSVNDFSEMSKIIDVLEYTKDVIGERVVKTGKFDPVTMWKNVDLDGKPITIGGKESMAYARLVDWMKMTVYGQQSRDEKIGKFDAGKLADFVNGFTAMSSLALNIFSGISNVTVGSAMVRMEAVAGEFVGRKSLAAADKIYVANLFGGLPDIGQRLEQNKMSLWFEMADTFQNYDRAYRNVDASRKTIFGRLLKTSSLYFINHAGEHFIQGRMSLALAQEVKVKDLLGNEMNLWEAYDVIGNKLVIKPDLKKVAGKKSTSLFKKSEDGQAFTQRDLIRFINRQNFLNKRLHGIYNNVDKSAAHQYALGRLALMFRKFIKPGWNRRFAKWTYNEEGEVATEGYYTTARDFFMNYGKELQEAKFSIAKNWNKLDDAQKANMLRLMAEWGYILAAATAAGILSGLADDDDDNYVYNLAAYQAYRMYSEIRFFTSFRESWRIVQSPAPAVYTIDKIVKFLDVWNWNKEISRGKYDGLNRFQKGAIELVPILGTTVDTITPEEQLKFYTNSGITIF